MTTGTHTIEVWADTRGQGICRAPACAAPLLWYEIVASGKRMCFEGRAVAIQTRHSDDRRLIEIFAADDTHWVRCPGAQRFRRRNAIFWR